MERRSPYLAGRVNSLLQSRVIPEDYASLRGARGVRLLERLRTGPASRTANECCDPVQGIGLGESAAPGGGDGGGSHGGEGSGPAAVATSPASPSKSSAAKSKVVRLCGLGFSAAAVRLALKKELGSVERAGVWLLDRSNAEEVREAERIVAEAAPLSAGCQARVGGLRAATHLNGVVVTVLRFEEEDQRWFVQPPGDVPVMAIRPRFLEREDAEALAASAAAGRAAAAKAEAAEAAAGAKAAAEAAEAVTAAGEAAPSPPPSRAAPQPQGCEEGDQQPTIEHLRERVRALIRNESGTEVAEEAEDLLQRLPRSELLDLLDGGGGRPAAAPLPAATDFLEQRRRREDDAPCRRRCDIRDVGPLRRALAWLAENSDDKAFALAAGGVALGEAFGGVGGPPPNAASRGSGGSGPGGAAEAVATAAAAAEEAEEEAAAAGGGREEAASSSQQPLCAQLAARLRRQSEGWQSWEADQERRFVRLEARESEAATRHAEWRALAEAEALQLSYLSERQSEPRGDDADMGAQVGPLVSDPLLEVERSRLLSMVRETEEVTLHVEQRDEEMQQRMRERELNLLEEQAEQLWLEEELGAARRQLVRKLRSSFLLATRSGARSSGAATDPAAAAAAVAAAYAAGRCTPVHLSSRELQRHDDQLGRGGAAGDGGASSQASTASSDEVWDLDWAQLSSSDALPLADAGRGGCATTASAAAAAATD